MIASRRISRRAFHAKIAATAAAVTLGRTSSATAQSPAGRKFPPGDYVDMHTHLGQTWNTTQPLSAEELLRWMDAHRVAQAIVLPLMSPESSSYLIIADYVLAETKPFRDRLIPFCSVDPRTSYTGGLKGLVAMLKKYVDAGARGFGE